MFRFNDFLTESLTTPVQFDLTDDTDIPKRIYGVFTLGETQYGMSIEETTYEKYTNCVCIESTQRNQDFGHLDHLQI